MENRGQKRTETIDELPADKRACSSFDFRPSSSNSSVQTPMESVTSTLAAHDADMDTSSHHSGSTRSDGDGEKDSAYGSCDSDGELREGSLSTYQRQRAVGDHEKLRKLLESFGQEDDESRILVALTELCEIFSFCTDGSTSSLMADSLSPVLVKYARHESNPDIMLLSLRAMTYLCDVHPRSSSFLVRHEAVPALCQRLMAIEYLDVAEQCLQALDKIAHEQPLACLQSGAIMAVLTYIDFFSTSLQRVALSTVVNICKKLPLECPSPFMEAVPTLCNLLLYEDKQLVENAATCLIKIVERVRHSSDMLDELCKHGLIHQAMHFIDLNCRTMLCRPVCSGLFGLLVKLASGSIVAVRTLFELNVSRILKDVLSTYDFNQHMPSVNVIDGHCNQVQVVLKLLNELLPSEDRDNNGALNMEKESFLTNQSDNLEKFGTDMLPILIQVFDSGASIDVCYGSLSAIRKLVYISKADMLTHLIKDNFSSFLAGVFTRKDHHVLMLALQIADTVMQKFPDIFSSFLKEGVLFAVDALLMPEKSSQFMFGVSQPSNAMSQKSAARIRCLCYAFDTGQVPSDSAKKTCKLEEDSIYNLAKQIKTTYFATETLYPDQGITDVLLKLRALAAALKDTVSLNLRKRECRQQKEEFGPILRQIMAQLYSSDHTSTFEFIESGILKELVNYLSGDQYGRDETELDIGFDHGFTAERSEVFGRLFLSSSDSPLEGFPLSVLVQKLQTALSSVENFPVIRSHPYRQRNSYATVPNGRYTSHPCLRVQFIRGEGESCLCDHSPDAVTVDPFASLDAVERYLWPKVRGHAKPPATQANSTLKSSPSELPSDMSSPGGKTPDLMECDSTFSDIQEDKPGVPHPVHDGSNTLRQATNDTITSSDFPTDHMENLQHSSREEDTSTCTKCCGPSSDEGTSPKLLFYLEEKLLDQSLSLYQVFLQRQINSGNDNVDNAKLWSEVFKVTYRRAAKSVQKSQDCRSRDSSESKRLRMYWQFPPFPSGIFVSSLENSGPVYDVLFLLKSLERMNRLQFHLISRARMIDFVEGRVDSLGSFKERISVPQNQFLSSKLTEKLEQQMQDPLAVSISGMPSWCNELMGACPFLFSFEARCKYFRMTAFGQSQAQPTSTSSNDSGGSNSRRQSPVGLPRKKFLVCRDRILESATQMMNLYARQKAVLEVEYNEEVGTGLGPTLEFYTLVSREFQKYSLGMWRGDHKLVPISNLQDEDSKIMDSCGGLFPRPWSPKVQTVGDVEFLEVVKKFTLLGQVVGKALQDGRFLDIPFSRAFYKLILGQELNVYDIHSFDPELGRALLEFQAVVERNRFLKSDCEENATSKIDSCFQTKTIEDLCLDFSLPGYPDFSLTSGPASELVNATNLEDYVSLVVDATINAGIRRQVEAFRSGVNQVFPISRLEVFTEEELERLLCGERDLCCPNELLDHIKVDHGYTASSPPITNLVEVIQEFDREQQRAFLQFATGTPRLPPGGLASLNPKLTIVRKHSSRCADDDLPSVMTCANYLKLPPYSSKEKMKEKLLYAITEGQGSFHLS